MVGGLVGRLSDLGGGFHADDITVADLAVVAPAPGPQGAVRLVWPGTLERALRS